MSDGQDENAPLLAEHHVAARGGDKPLGRSFGGAARLTRWQKLAFAIGAVPSSMTHTITGFFISPFLLEVAKVPAYQYGIILIIGRVCDALTDPMIGVLASKTRKRPWLLLSVVPCAISYCCMWLVFPTLHTWNAFAYYLVMYCTFQACFTCFYVPFTCLTMLLTDDPADRDSATAYRMAVDVLSVLIASVAQSQVLANVEDQREAYLWCGVGVAALVVVSGVICYLGVPERAHAGAAVVDSEPALAVTAAAPGGAAGGPTGEGAPAVVKPANGEASAAAAAAAAGPDGGHIPFFEGFKMVMKSRAYVSLSLMYLFAWITITLIQSNIILFFRYSLRVHHIFQYLLVLLLVSTFAFVGIWNVVLRRIGKVKTYVLGMSVLLPILVALFFMPARHETAMYFVAAGAGMGVSIAYLLPWQMLPDVIAYESERRVAKGLPSSRAHDSFYYSLYCFFQKLASGACLGFSSLALSVAGYINDGDPDEQPKEVDMALRILVAPVPFCTVLLSFACLYFYPIRR